MSENAPSRYCRHCKGVRPVVPDRPDWVLHGFGLFLFLPVWLIVFLVVIVLTVIWPNYCEGCGRMAGRARRGPELLGNAGPVCSEGL